MPFYDHGEYAGEDAYEVNFDMSDESRQYLIYEYIYRAYDLVELASELSVGTLGTDRRELAIRALEYIRDHTENGRGPDFGGYTWSDDDIEGSDNRRSRSAPKASKPKASAPVRPAKASCTRRSKTPGRTDARTYRRLRSWPTGSGPLRGGSSRGGRSS